MPILTGGRQRGDEQVARAELEQARLQLRQIEELAALDTRSAWAELLAARAAWEASAGTVQQATRAYEIADVRYRRRRVDAARAVGLAAAAAAGGGQPRAGGARPAGRAGARGAAAGPAARRVGVTPRLQLLQPQPQAPSPPQPPAGDSGTRRADRWRPGGNDE